MAQLLTRRGTALRPTAPRAATSNRSCKLVIKCFKNGDETEAKEKAKVQFQLPHHVEWGQDVCLVGEADALGNWDAGKCIPMAWHDGDVWTAQAELPQGAHVEYKYIIREGDGEVKEVVQWQPCNNLDVTADAEELTVRDHWEGELHEVHPGTLPLPLPPVPEEEQQVLPDERVTPAAEAEVAPAPAAAAAQEAPVHEQRQQLEAAPPRAAAASLDVEAPVLTAEEIAAGEAEQEAAAAAAGPAAAAVAPAVLSGNGSGSKQAAQVMDSAEEEMAAHIRQPHKGAVTPAWLAEKSSEQKTVMARAATAAAAPNSFADLPTSELKDMCKQRGLSVKGQRRELLQRLQQHQA